MSFVFRSAAMLVFAAAASSPFAQQPLPMAFDVATVKPHNPADGGSSWRMPADGWETKNVTLRNMLASAWSLRADQVAGEPGWADEDGWDVTAKLTEMDAAGLKALTAAQRGLLMQHLLEDRFHVKAHLETREGAVQVLTVARGGLKVKPAAPDPDRKPLGGAPYGGMRMSFGGEVQTIDAHAILWTGLVGNLSSQLSRTVIDRTGQPADQRIDMHLRWASEVGTTAPSADDDAPPLAVAVEQQLGLHLEAARGPVTMLIVEHAEKPSAN